MRSFVTFDYLPLVHFELSEGISDAEATHLLAKKPSKVAEIFELKIATRPHSD